MTSIRTDIDNLIGQETDPKNDTIFGITADRFVAFVLPHVNIAAGFLASWLTVHVHVLAAFHVGNDKLSSTIAQGIVWLITTAFLEIARRQWVKGRHIQLAAATDVVTVATKSAVSTQAQEGQLDGPDLDPPAGEYHPEEFAGVLDKGDESDESGESDEATA